MRPSGANVTKLFVREGGRERLLFDPETLKDASGTHSSMDYWVVAPGGRHVAIGASAAGSENSTIRVLDTSTGRMLPETIDRAQYASPSWLPDSSGFFYMRGREGAKLGTPDYYADRIGYLHKLNTSAEADRKIIDRASAGAIPMTPYDFPIVVTTPGSDIAALLLVQGVRRELVIYTAPVADVAAGRAVWRKATSADDRVTNLTLKGRDLYLLSEKDAPLGRILKVNATAPDLARATVALPEGKLALENVFATGDGIYVQVMDGGNQRFVRLGDGGRATDVAMPFNAGVYGVSASPDQLGFYTRMAGWLNASGIWRYDPATGTLTDTGLSPKPPLDLSAYGATSTFATARDGTKVPVTIIARKDYKRDGSAPLLADAYGSYQISSSPAFNVRGVAFLERGGIIATVGVRGGGEYGRPWHEAGKKTNKPNTWRDLIDASEFLIKEGWTSKDRLAILGGSAGGITVGRALTERPDLFAMVVSAVGISNPVRGEAEQNNAPNIPEFGSAKLESDFPAVLAMDSYMAVKDGTRYPKVILTTGMTDPRVAPWHAGKMAARLQSATASEEPVLLRVDFNAGHGQGSTRTQRDEEQADVAAALLALADE